MKPFQESLRYEYDLTPDSVVIDVGCHVGSFSKTLVEKYGCKIYALEPINQFYQQARQALRPHPSVTVLHAAVGNQGCLKAIFVRGDSSGEFNATEEGEVVVCVPADKLLEYIGERCCRLLKLNCEGGEFAILESLLNVNIRDYHNIQVQPHKVVPAYEYRWQEIRAKLSKTHEQVWGSDWVWEGWKLK